MARVKCERVQQCIPLRTSKRHVYISFYASLPDCDHEQQQEWKIKEPELKHIHCLSAFWSKDHRDLDQNGLPYNFCNVPSPLLSNMGLLSSQPDGGESKDLDKQIGLESRLCNLLAV